MKFVAFSGPAHAGKTTLVNDLSKELKSMGYKVRVIAEIAQEFTRVERASLETQYKIMEKQIQLEWRALNHEPYKYDYIISDRTVYDNMVYSLMTMVGREKADISLFDSFLRADKIYDFVFIIPEYFPIDTNDATRNPDPHWQKTVLDGLIYIMQAHRENYIFLLGNPEERVDKVINTIGAVGF